MQPSSRARVRSATSRERVTAKNVLTCFAGAIPLSESMSILETGSASDARRVLRHKAVSFPLFAAIAFPKARGQNLIDVTAAGNRQFRILTRFFRSSLGITSCRLRLHFRLFTFLVSTLVSQPSTRNSYLHDGCPLSRHSQRSKPSSFRVRYGRQSWSITRLISTCVPALIVNFAVEFIGFSGGRQIP